LALYHVAVHLCHHCKWRQAYEFILNEVLFESRVPREIVHTGWAMNYSYGESCPECEKEILRKMKEREEE
ncbi:MAG: hypothetical protein JJU11_07710, partial [Candidatus Sumerlaeia bacterium]|nr:hypothetical protein [Candidatus Sumerlaeia bacterium]